MTPADLNGPRRGVIATSVRPVDQLVGSLKARGWHVAIISGATSKAEALDAFAAALRFPAHFGRNLDALWDCLTDLEQPTAMVWAGWEPLAVHAPGEWAALLGVLRARAAARDGAAFAVVFTVAPDAAGAVVSEPTT